MAQAITETVSREGYTCWALAILRNHMHAVIRTHRDKSEIMLEKLAIATHDALHARRLIPESHPVWSQRPYKVYLITPDDVHGRIRYVEENPMKEGLPPQRWTASPIATCDPHSLAHVSWRRISGLFLKPEQFLHVHIHFCRVTLQLGC